MPTKEQKHEIKARFLKMVSTPDANGCRKWLGYTRPDGYGMFALAEGGGYASELAHRVAYAIGADRFGLLRFYGGPADKRGPVVRHLPKCPLKSCVEFAHLRLGTQAENIDDNHINGKMLRGEDVGNAKLSNQDAADIKATANATPRTKTGQVKCGLVAALAQRFSVVPTVISDIANGKWWRHIDAADGRILKLDLTGWGRAGERNAFAKLTQKKVDEIRAAAASSPRVKYGDSTRLAPGIVGALAKKYGVASITIWQVLNGSHWSN